MIGTKIYNKYKIIVIALSLITIFVALFTSQPNGYQFVFSIPLLYFILFLFNSRFHKYSNEHFGMFILNLLMFIRYVITIFIIILNNDFGKPPYTGVTPTPSSFEMAIFYILAEMFAIFTTIFLFSDKIYKIGDNNIIPLEKKENGSNLIYFLLIAISTILMVLYPNHFFPNISQFINSSYANDELIQTNGFLDIIFYSVKIVIMSLIVDYFIEKYNKSQHFSYVFLSYLTVAVFIVLNTSSSRLNMILPFLFFLLLTKDIFKKQGFLLFLGSTIVLVFSIMIITVYKNTWLFPNGANLNDFFRVLSSQVQEYTSNVRPVAQGIESNSNFKNNITLDTFNNDIIGSIPVINHFIDSTNRSNVYYNSYILNNGGKYTPLIMPLVTISASFFSPYFCWLLTSLCIVIMMLVDRKQNYKDTTSFIYRYLNIYFVFVFASCIYCNSQIIVGRLVTKALPVYLVYLLNQKIKVRVKR